MFVHRLRLEASETTAGRGSHLAEVYPATDVVQVDPDEIHGLDSLMAEAVTLKFVAAPLSKEQVAEFVQIVK